MASPLPADESCTAWAWMGCGCCACLAKHAENTQMWDSTMAGSSDEDLASPPVHTPEPSFIEPAPGTLDEHFPDTPSLSIEIPQSPGRSYSPPPSPGFHRHSSYTDPSPVHRFGVSLEHLSVEPDYINAISPPSSAYSPCGSSSSVSTPASASTWSNPPSPITPESELSVSPSCELVDVPATAVIKCPYCPPESANYFVGPSDPVTCSYGQHLVQYHGVPESSRLTQEWVCTWPGCSCQGQGRNRQQRCIDYHRDGQTHPAHVADPWHHLLTVHFGFKWRCKCGKERSSKNSFNNHLRSRRPRSQSTSGVAKKPRQRRVRSTSDLKPGDIQQVNDGFLPVYACGPEASGPQPHPQHYLTIPPHYHPAYQ